MNLDASPSVQAGPDDLVSRSVARDLLIRVLAAIGSLLCLCFCLGFFLQFRSAPLPWLTALVLFEMFLGTCRPMLGIALVFFLLPAFGDLPRDSVLPYFSTVELLWIGLLAGYLAKRALGRSQDRHAPLGNRWPLLFGVLVLASVAYCLGFFRHLPLPLQLAFIRDELLQVHFHLRDHSHYFIRAALTIWVGLSVFFVLVRELRDNQRVRWFLGCVAASSVWAAVGFSTQALRNLTWVTGYSGPFEDRNSLAAFLVATTPLVLSFLAGSTSTWRRTVWILILVANSVFVTLSFSLTGFLVYLAICTATTVWIWKRRQTATGRPLTLRANWKAVTACILVVAVIAAAAAASWALLPGVRSQIHGRFEDLGGDAMKTRQAWSQAALQMFRSAPLTGLGIGRYYAEFAHFRLGLDEELRQRTSLYVHGEHAHNYWLQLLAELGILGPVVFGAIVFSFLRIGLLGTLKRDQIGPPGVAALSLLGLALVSLTGHPLVLPEFQILFWGLCAAIAVAGSDSDSFPRDDRRRALWFWPASALLVSLAYFAAPAYRHPEIGFYPPEPEGFRWTSGAAAQWGSWGKPALEIEWKWLRPVSGPEPARVFFYSTGVESTVRVLDSNWHVTRLPVQSFWGVETPSTWNPRLSQMTSDFRSLGLAIRRVTPADDALVVVPKEGVFAPEIWDDGAQWHWMDREATLELRRLDGGTKGFSFKLVGLRTQKVELQIDSKVRSLTVGPNPIRISLEFGNASVRRLRFRAEGSYEIQSILHNGDARRVAAAIGSVEPE